MALEILQVLIVLFLAVVFHEYAHGWSADRLGDPTARQAGRLTLNPIKHIDPIGMIVVPLLLRVLQFPFVIGWAKPVPVNFANLRNPRRDMILVALAGPATNFLIAFLLSRLLVFPLVPFVRETVTMGVLINLIIGLFNLVPIPPLDGSRCVMGILPVSWARIYGRLEPFGLVFLLILMNLGFLKFVWILAIILGALLGIRSM